jgi:hypothetical protein
MMIPSSFPFYGFIAAFAAMPGCIKVEVRGGLRWQGFKDGSAENTVQIDAS